MPRVDAPRARRTFARLNKVLDVPNLIDIQRRSFDWLVDPENGGLRETIDDISPIEDYTGHLAVNFGEFHFDEPGRLHRRVPREGPHLLAPADRHGRLHQPRDRRDPRAVGLHGRLPVDDRARHVHHQRHRARRRHPARPLPGRLPDGAQGPREAGLHGEPHAGARLVARAGDRQEGQGLRPHRPQAQAAGHRPAARDDLQPRDRRLGRGEPRRTSSASTRSSLDLFDNSLYLRNTIETDTEATKTKKGALIELFKKQRPGEPPRVDAAYALLQQLFFDPKRYDLTRVGRYKLNSRLNLDIDLDTRTLTHDDIHALVASSSPCRKHPRHPRGRRDRDQGLRRRGRSRCRASPSPSTSTSTSTSATAACAPSASSSRRPSASASTGWSASSASASPPRTRTRSRRRRS